MLNSIGKLTSSTKIVCRLIDQSRQLNTVPQDGPLVEADDPAVHLCRTDFPCWSAEGLSIRHETFISWILELRVLFKEIGVESPVGNSILHLLWCE